MSLLNMQGDRSTLLDSPVTLLNTTSLHKDLTVSTSIHGPAENKRQIIPLRQIVAPIDEIGLLKRDP
jgi:hypothetical protein